MHSKVAVSAAFLALASAVNSNPLPELIAAPRNLILPTAAKLSTTQFQSSSSTAGNLTVYTPSVPQIDACNVLLSQVLTDALPVCTPKTPIPLVNPANLDIATVQSVYIWDAEMVAGLCTQSNCIAAFSKYADQIKSACPTGYIGTATYKAQGYAVQSDTLKVSTTYDKLRASPYCSKSGNVLCIPHTLLAVKNYFQYQNSSAVLSATCGACGAILANRTLDGSFASAGSLPVVGDFGYTTATVPTAEQRPLLEAQYDFICQKTNFLNSSLPAQTDDYNVAQFYQSALSGAMHSFGVAWVVAVVLAVASGFATLA